MHCDYFGTEEAVQFKSNAILASMERESLVDVINGMERWGEQHAYVHRRGYRTERWSYGEVLRIARRLAREMESRGIAKGDRVVLWGDNSAEWASAFFGCVLRGAVVVPMDRGASNKFALKVAEQVDAKLMIVGREISAYAARERRS